MEYTTYEGRPGVEIVFSNGSNDISLFYAIYEWHAATKFYNLLTDAIANNKSFISDTSFNVTTDDEDVLLKTINNLVFKINKKYNINIPVITADSDLNFLHRATVPVNCELWKPINDSIHSYEQYKAQINSEPRVNAYFRFEPRKLIPLNSEDFLFFKADREFGDLCLNYTHKGKHWLELQSDNDPNSLTDGQLQAETHLEAGGYLVFRPPSPSPFYRLNKFIQWFNSTCPGKPITPEMALGYLLVGKLVIPQSWDGFYIPERSNWVRMLCKYKTIKNINLLTIKDVPTLLKKSRMIE
jgi:hypothetical protein